MTDPQQWIDTLGAMQPGEIRTLMQDEGVTGYMTAAGACPIANFLYRKTDQFVLVEYEAIFCDGVEFEIPEAVLRFVAHFDDEDYPELIAHE